MEDTCILKDIIDSKKTANFTSIYFIFADPNFIVRLISSTPNSETLLQT